MSITVGIDPGLTGAIALVDSYGCLVDAYDMPVVGGLVSAHGIVDLEGWDEHQFGPVVIEDVHSMPKQGVASSFGFGRSKGVVEGVFAAQRLPIVYVSPQKWKKALGLTSDKGACRRRAIELWPANGTKLFARVKDDGRAEAALIAYWWLQHGKIGAQR